jgi:hypothetical protein
VVQKIFEPKREDITGDWMKLHNVELDDLYFSADIFVVIKPTTKMGQACGTCRGRYIPFQFWWGKLKERTT